MTAERFTVDSDGKYWDTVSKKYVTITHLFYLVEKLEKENEQLKSENKRLTDKLNETALEFLNYGFVSMGKATEISEMCYYDFLKYRKENGNPMELKI